MAKNSRYPYLAKRMIGNKQYVVFFSEENYGTVVLSEITDDPDVALGTINDFDESTFEILGPGQIVRITNFPDALPTIENK